LSEKWSCLGYEPAIIDGEIIVLDPATGNSNFGLLAQRSHLEKPFDIGLRSKKIPVRFMAFDLLSFKGDLTYLPLRTRREMLYGVFKPDPHVFMWSLPLHKDVNGIYLFNWARRLGLEGIVGKHLESPYCSGKRSAYWKKCKCEKTKDLTFTSYTVNPAGIRCETDEGIAVQVAGFNSRVVRKVLDEKGKVVIEVKYLNETENGRLRMPTFKRLVDVEVEIGKMGVIA